jgi:hypothetical protein
MWIEITSGEYAELYNRHHKNLHVLASCTFVEGHPVMAPNGKYILTEWGFVSGEHGQTETPFLKYLDTAEKGQQYFKWEPSPYTPYEPSPDDTPAERQHKIAVRSELTGETECGPWRDEEEDDV